MKLLLVWASHGLIIYQRLIGIGANGNIVIGNEPASARYTEARLSKEAEEGLFQGIKKNNVNMIKNFSEDEEWPEVLPAVMPRLLLNGSQGIGVTISNCWLPMNLKEVVKSLKNYIETQEISKNDYLVDFPSGGVIINKDELNVIHQTGKGKVIVRAKAEIKGKSILITELPYQIFVEPLLEEIRKMIAAGELDEIKEIYNKTDKKRLLIEIECKSNPEGVLKKLFLKTSLQKSYHANQFALVGKTPKLLTLKEYYDLYIQHNIDCVTRELNFDLNKATARLEILNGLLKALEDIDNVIKIIKSSSSAAAAKENLIKEYNLSKVQADAIVEMKLGRLANLEKIELENEKHKLEKETEIIKNTLFSKDNIIKVFIDRLDKFTSKYGTDRKSELQQVSIEKDNELSTVVPEDVVVVLGKEGSIKKIPRNSFKPQKRGGVGLKTTEEAPLVIINTNTLDNLLLFTDKGVMYKLLVDKIPSGSNTTKGVNVLSLINSQDNEKIIAATSISKEKLPKNVIFVTKNGLVKKTEFSEYTKTKRSTGIQAIKLKEGDSIAAIELMDEEEMLIVTKEGLAIRFETKGINPQGKNTLGVKGITLLGEDEVIATFKIGKNDKKIAVFTSIGTGKIVSLDKLPIQGKGGRGNLLKVRKDEYSIVGAFVTNQTEEALVIGENTICINLKDIVEYESPYSQGVKIIQGNIIKSVSKI